MSLRKFYRGRRVSGMQRWHCPCCNPFVYNRNGKVWARRQARRTDKMKVYKDSE